jgi:hypothetical protein
MDKHEYAKIVYGLKKGDYVSPAMGAQIEKELEYYRKKKVDAMVKAEFDPEILNTQQGMYARYDGTNAVAIAPMTTNAQGQVVRGEPLRGYAADPYAAEAGAPAPLAGGGMAATNAPTAAPTPQPAPTPSYTMTQAEASQRFGTNMPVGTHRVPKLGGVLVITP